MKRIVAIVPPESGNGFACCGIRQVVTPPGEAHRTLLAVLAERENGVVILDERLLAEVKEDEVKEFELRWPGVLVILPAPLAGGGVEDYAARLIRRAVGYHVKVSR